MAAVTMAACATAAAAAVLAHLASSSSCDDGVSDGAATEAAAETPSSSPATSQQECAVCLSELAASGAGSSESSAVRTLPGCGHGFHAGCIDRWLPLRPECPLCRRPVLLEVENSGQPDAGRAGAASAAATPAWARPERIACGFGDGRVVWTRSPSYVRR
jgi:hypothetical protein